MQCEQIFSGPHFTAREHQILELVAFGRSAKEIAIKIRIAPRTAERHIENMRLKLNARNRAHLVTQAIYLGILAIDKRTSANDRALVI